MDDKCAVFWRKLTTSKQQSIRHRFVEVVTVSAAHTEGDVDQKQKQHQTKQSKKLTNIHILMTPKNQNK